jgi:hypothetical protein
MIVVETLQLDTPPSDVFMIDTTNDTGGKLKVSAETRLIPAMSIRGAKTSSRQPAMFLRVCVCCIVLCFLFCVFFVVAGSRGRW